jgi:hypothetical protein
VTWRAHASGDADFFVRNITGIYLFDGTDSDPILCRTFAERGPDGALFTRTTYEKPDPMRHLDPTPSLWVPRGAEVAVADALMRAVGERDPGDARALRADLDRERDRFDRLLDAVLAKLG